MVVAAFCCWNDVEAQEQQRGNMAESACACMPCMSNLQHPASSHVDPPAAPSEPSNPIAKRCRLRTGTPATAQRLLEVTGAVRLLLSTHLLLYSATPLVVYAALATGKLAPALLQLLAHRSMAELAGQEALTEQVKSHGCHCFLRWHG